MVLPPPPPVPVPSPVFFSELTLRLVLCVPHPWTKQARMFQQQRPWLLTSLGSLSECAAEQVAESDGGLQGGEPKASSGGHGWAHGGAWWGGGGLGRG